MRAGRDLTQDGQHLGVVKVVIDDEHAGSAFLHHYLDVFNHLHRMCVYVLFCYYLLHFFLDGGCERERVTCSASLA